MTTNTDPTAHNTNSANARRTPPTTSLMINAKKIPALLREFPHWLVWRYRRNTRNPNGKPLKVPYYVSGAPRSGALGTDADVSQLTDFTTALDTVQRSNGHFDGIGLAILPRQQNITVIDLDDCISSDGEYSELATELMHSGSYVERSPSGRGLRAVYTGLLLNSESKRNFHVANGERVEVYCGGAYTTFTGRRVSRDADSGVSAMPAPLRQKLIDGMHSAGIDPAHHSSSGITSLPDDTDAPLASMNAAPLPNMTPAQALRVLKALPERWGSSGEGTWYQVAAALHMQFDGSEEGYAVLDAWSATKSGYDEENNRRRWDTGFSHSRGKQNVLSMRNLVFEARDAGAKFKHETLQSWGLKRAAEDITAREDILLPGETDEATSLAWQPINLGATVASMPERPAGTVPLVQDWLYEGTVALFSSNGGGGKSYVAATFCAMAATGGLWFDKPVTKGRVLMVNGEDPLHEIQHRLWGIRTAYGIDAAALAAPGGSSDSTAGGIDLVNVAPMLHKALYVAGTDYGKTEFTSAFTKLQDLVSTGRYRYVVIDNVAKFYMANENARPMVDEFISGLAALAVQYHMAVLLIGHDSKLAASTGASYSGSTAWNNSVRTRWSLTSKDGIRTLLVEKNNYGAAGHGGTFAWDTDAHILRMQHAVGPNSAHTEFERAERIEAVRDIVVRLYRQGESTAAGTTRGPLGAITENPWVLENGIDAKQLRELLNQCVEDGLLEIEEYSATNRAKKQRYAPPTASIV